MLPTRACKKGLPTGRTLKYIIKYITSLPDNTRGAVTILIAAAGFSVMALLIKLAGATLHVTQVIFVRQLLILLIMTPKLSKNFPESIKTTQPLMHLARVSAALVAMMCGFTAVIHMPLADATAIGFAKSLFVTIFAIILLKETVGIRRWSATLIGFLGVIIMMQPGTSGFNIYGIYAAVAAVAAGLVMVLLRIISRKDPPSALLFYQGIGVAVILFIPAMINWKPPTATEWILLLAVGVMGYLSQLCNIYAYKFGEASLLAPLEYTRILYATLIGLIVFGDLPGINTIIGASIVVLASAYTIHRERSLNKQRTQG